MVTDVDRHSRVEGEAATTSEHDLVKAGSLDRVGEVGDEVGMLLLIRRGGQRLQRPRTGPRGWRRLTQHRHQGEGFDACCGKVLVAAGVSEVDDQRGWRVGMLVQAQTWRPQRVGPQATP